MYEQIRRNKQKTFVVLLAFVVLVAIVGLAFNLLIGYGLPGVIIAIAVAISMSFFSYFYSDKVALRAANAHEADPTEYQRLHNLVEGLCIASGLPKPKIYVVDDPSPNAFATGRNPKHCAIAVTTGLLEKMNRVELEGVLAHELSHIKNYDVLVSTIAVTAVGAIVVLSQIGSRFMFFGGGRRRDSNDNNGGGGMGALLLIIPLLLLILAPFAAKLLQFSISRNRECLADASAVQLTRYPPGLISALEKLKQDDSVVRKGSSVTASMWIEQPMDSSDKSKPSWFSRAFATHPPLDERIARLKEM